MKKIYKTSILIIVLFTIISCNKNPEMTSNSSSVISFSSTIINNKVSQMNLQNPFTNTSLYINEKKFCESNNINEFYDCNLENIEKFENSFGNDMIFDLDGKKMKIYNPELIIFDCPKYIDKTQGVTITWNIDENNHNDILISVIPRLDANGNTYTHKNSHHFSQLNSDNGSYTLTPQDLANFNSGDMIDIILMRGNVENYGKETIEVYNTNVHVAKIL